MAVSIEHKKGEVNELKASLRNPAIERDPAKKRDLVKRVIAYMTLGIDVSKLFSEMIMATSSKDHVVKKMVYLYICNYAAVNPELALLAINTLQKDCRDDDPMTRGLALRSFTSLRLPNIVEYLPSVIKAGLRDQSPYVRKTAVMSCVRLHLFDPDALRDTDIVNTLYAMLRDRDALVVSNCISALDEILASEGGMVVNKPIVHHLLNRMREFNEWSQCVVLGLVAKYRPAEQAETFDIMNLLEERLKHSNSAVVLGATKIFLHLTQNMPTVHQQVYARLRAPLLTLVAGGIFEQSYVCLKHIKLIASRSPDVFAGDFKNFFCRYNDPSCVKLLKLDILIIISNASNVGEVIEEVAECVTDADTSVARGSVSAIGQIGVKVPACVGIVVEQLLKFLEVDIEHVSAEAILSLKNLLRKFPEAVERFISGIGTFVRNVEEPAAKVALLWMIAEYGHVIPESPYLLESMIDNFSEEQSQEVRLELLSTCAKLFFRRPAEMQRMLGRLLDAAIADASYTDVHDRAMLYYRLLLGNTQRAEAVLTHSDSVKGAFVEEVESELQDRIFEEFNTLSVIYGLPSDHFTKPPVQVEDRSSVQHTTTERTSNVHQAQDGHVDEKENDEQQQQQQAAQGTGGGIDLLGLDDVLDASSEQQVLEPRNISLSPLASLDASSFQQKWASLPQADSWSVQAQCSVGIDELPQLFASLQVKCMAFGNVGEEAKFYFYAQETGGVEFLLVELLVSRATFVCRAIVKGVGPSAVAFSSLVRDALR